MSAQTTIFDVINPEQSTKPAKPLRIAVDGASRGNPGPSGAGIHMILSDGHSVQEHCAYLGKKTNNQAEYLALMYALFIADKQELLNPTQRVTVVSDSELLIKQLRGQYKIKNPILERFKIVIDHLVQHVPVTFTHVLRDKNKDADRLANEGVDKKTPLPTNFILFLSKFGIQV